MNDVEKGDSRSNRWTWLPVALVWLFLTVWSLLRIPIPGVNEPHYLTKARHWWNPAWCAGDFFLDSSNPHQVFYATFGWLTDVVSLPASAMIGRVLGLLILAIGWQRLAQCLTSRRWAGLLAVPVFLTLQSLGNFSGEWLVGGIEAKVPAYGLLFWSLGSFLSGKYLAAAMTAGLAVSFHPLVGLWGVIAGIMATGYSIAISLQKRHPEENHHAEHLRKPCWKTLALMGALFVLAALPGLIPALQILEAKDAKTERIANQVQVASRLAHHLDPMQFPKESYRYGGLLLILWGVLECSLPWTPQRRWWRAFVLSTVILIGMGILIGWGPRPVTQMFAHVWRLKLLKFYFFRIGDVMVPVALSLAGVQAFLLWTDGREKHFSRAVICGAAVCMMTVSAFGIPFPDNNPSRLKPQQMVDWIATCHWLRENNLDGELSYVADTGWALRWFAEQPEYVNFKDMPQDSASVVEWNNRLWTITRWRIAAFQDEMITDNELQDLRRQTNIRFLICHRLGPISSRPIYQNETFRIYKLPEISGAQLEKPQPRP